MDRLLVTTTGDGCSQVDASLINPSGLIVAHRSIWVASTGGSAVHKYRKKDDTGMYQTREVIPVPSPVSLCVGREGIIYVGTSSGSIYTIPKDSNTASLATGFNIGAPITGLAYYKGRLYIAVPSLWYVQVWDVSADTPKELYAIVDKELSNFGYRPLGVSEVSCSIYITYENENPSAGFGYVNKYVPCDNVMHRFASRGYLARPYSVAKVDGALYISNASGYILRYSEDGQYFGKLKLSNGSFFSDGLRVIASHKGKLYYTAATSSASMGTLGVIYL